MSKNQSKNEHEIADRAIRLLGVRPRTRDELEKKLRVDGPPEVVEQVLDRLGELRYIDDRQFALDRARSLVINKGWGPAKVRADLLSRKVASEFIDEALEAAYEEAPIAELIRRVITKKFGSEILEQQPDHKLKTKAMRFLFSRGFDSESIRGLWSTF